MPKLFPHYLSSFLTLPKLTAYVIPSHPLLPNSWPCPLFITRQSPCATYIAAASLGSVVQTHRDGKLVKATKLAQRNLHKERKEQKPNVSQSRMNLRVKEEDIQDEGM